MKSTKKMGGMEFENRQEIMCVIPPLQGAELCTAELKGGVIRLSTT